MSDALDFANDTVPQSQHGESRKTITEKKAMLTGRRERQLKSPNNFLPRTSVNAQCRYHTTASLHKYTLHARS